MQSFQDAVLVAADASLLAVIFSPLCTLAPRLLVQCIRGLFDSIGKFSAEGIEGKTKLLRAILACQQGLSMLFESSSRLDPTVNKELQELLGEEFSRLRRYFTEVSNHFFL